MSESNIIERLGDDAPIFRYMDFSKFLHLIETKKLFFSCSTTLDDMAEGIYIPRNFITTHQLYSSFINKKQRKDYDFNTEREKIIKKNSEQDLMKQFICINSWHTSLHESLAMWKIYVPSGIGVCIESSIKKLKTSLSDTTLPLLIENVKYERDHKKIKNYLDYFFIKEPHFYYEHEVRALIDINPRYEDIKNNNKSLKDDPYIKEIFTNSGLYVNVKLEELIDQVIVSPFTQNWFQELIETQIKRIGLKINVKSSVIDLKK